MALIGIHVPHGSVLVMDSSEAIPFEIVPVHLVRYRYHELDAFVHSAVPGHVTYHLVEKDDAGQETDRTSTSGS